MNYKYLKWLYNSGTTQGELLKMHQAWKRLKRELEKPLKNIIEWITSR